VKIIVVFQLGLVKCSQVSSCGVVTVMLSVDTLTSLYRLAVVASAFLFFNLGLRVVPIRTWLLRAIRKDESLLTEEQVKGYVHGVAHRITSHLHNTFAIPLGLWIVLDPALRDDPLYGTSPAGEALVTLSAGYFVHDLLVVCLCLEEAGLGFLLHAFFCSALYCYGVFYQQLHYFAAAFILWEMSTPFVQLRWFLYEMGMKNTRVYVANGIMMMAAFFLSRLVMGAYFSYVFWGATQAELENPRPGGFPAPGVHFFRVANVCLQGLNCFWFYKMLRGALQLLRKGRPREKAS